MGPAGIGAVVHLHAQQLGPHPIVGGNGIGVHILRLLPAGVLPVDTGVSIPGQVGHVSQKLQLVLAPLLKIRVDALGGRGGGGQSVP